MELFNLTSLEGNSQRQQKKGLWSLITIVFLFLVAGLVAILLSIPLNLPIGPMNWDINLYFDAINRINNGQIPEVDFKTPVGPLGYWLATIQYNIFPHGQPILLVQFSLMLLTLPIIAILSILISRYSYRTALALTIPFIIFSLCPTGTVDFYSYPGFSGAGTYNRHGAELMYLATCTVFFLRGSKYQAGLLAILAIALFLSKITAFLGAGLIVLIGVLTGFVSLSTMLIAGFIFLLAMAGLDLTTGITTAYIESILSLANQNQSTLLPRFMTVFSQRFDVVFTSGLLCLALFIRMLTQPYEKDTTNSSVATTIWRKINALLNHDFIIFGTVVFAGIFYETQNTGSQAFIMIWPVILLILIDNEQYKRRFKMLTMILCLATILPTFTKIIHKTIRASVGGLTYQHLDNKNLKNLGQVSAKTELINRIIPMEKFYLQQPDSLIEFANQGMLHDQILFSQIDFQLLLLNQFDQAIDLIKAYETEHNRYFETILNMDFTNPFPFLMDRNAPKYAQIGADPSRTLSAPNEKELAELKKTDLLLESRCPILINRINILQYFEPTIAQTHKKVALSKCWNAYIKKLPEN